MTRYYALSYHCGKINVNNVRVKVMRWSYSSYSSEPALILNSLRCSFKSKNTSARTHKVPCIVIGMEAEK